MERFAANSRYATKITSLESDIQQQPACWVPLHPSTIYLPKSSPQKNNSLCSRGWWAVSPGGAAYMMPMMPMMPHDAAHVNHLSSCSSRPVFDVFALYQRLSYIAITACFWNLSRKMMHASPSWISVSAEKMARDFINSSTTPCAVLLNSTTRQPDQETAESKAMIYSESTRFNWGILGVLWFHHLDWCIQVHSGGPMSHVQVLFCM